MSSPSSIDVFPDQATLNARCLAAMPPYASSLIYVLESAGFEAWCVGGFVRDAALEKPCHDIDVACSAHWQETKAACEAAGMRVRETGTAHGTVTVIINREDGSGADAVEVTTFRTDGSYTDSRHPSSVTFVKSIEEDLARRDFTINAMAFHPTRGFADPHHGLDDLRAGVIRIVGDPHKRLSEDALRILRACRFKSKLGFTIHPDTYEQMLYHKHLLAKVSTERITHEIDEMLMGDFVHDAIMETVDVISFAVPELAAMKNCPQHNKYHIYDVLEHTAWAVQHARKDRLVRWAAFCHDMGKPAARFEGTDGITHFYGHAKVGAVLVEALADRMLMSNVFKADLKSLVLHHDDSVELNARCIKRLLAHFDGRVDLFRDFCDVRRADTLAHAPFCHEHTSDIDEMERLLEEMIAANDAFSLKSLAVNGNDIMQCGISAGPEVGAMLHKLLEAVIEEELPNERTALLNAVQAYK